MKTLVDANYPEMVPYTYHELPPIVLPEGVQNPYPKSIYLQNPIDDDSPDFAAAIRLKDKMVKEAIDAEDTRNTENLIHLMYRDFLSQYGIVPNVLFLCMKDYYLLIEQSKYIAFPSRPLMPAAEEIRYMNMVVKKANLDKSYVALIPK